MPQSIKQSRMWSETLGSINTTESSTFVNCGLFQGTNYSMRVTEYQSFKINRPLFNQTYEEN